MKRTMLKYKIITEAFNNIIDHYSLGNQRTLHVTMVTYIVPLPHHTVYRDYKNHNHILIQEWDKCDTQYLKYTELRSVTMVGVFIITVYNEAGWTYSRHGWIRTQGKFGQHKEWGCYLNKSYSIQKTILLT